MLKPLSIFSVQQPRPDASALALKICSRRLERQQKSFIANYVGLADWFEGELAVYRARLETGHARRDADKFYVAFDDQVEPTYQHHPECPRSLPREERDRILAWCSARVDKMALPGAPLPTTLGKDEKKDIQSASLEMGAVYLSEHEVDVAFAGVHKDFPWLGMLTEKAWRQALRRSRSGLPAGVGPLLLLGPPGMGKSSWARAVADALGLPRIDVDAAQTGGIFEIQGLAKGWGSADKGRLVSTIIARRIANPLLVVDEIDVGSNKIDTNRGGSIPGLFKVMMGLVEPSTAAKWVCPFYQVPFDMRHVSWIATCNSISFIEQALLDRMTIIDLPDLTHEQILDFAAAEAKKKFDDNIVEAIITRVHESLRKGKRLSLRHVVKLIGRVEEAAERPVIH